CGLAIVDCGLAVRPANPQSPIRNPQLLAGALILASLPSLAGAQQPDSLPTDTLAAVVVSGVRLPTVRELARGLAGRTATLHAADLDARGVRSRADALEQLPGRGAVPAEGEVAVSGGSFGRYELKARAGDRRGMWDYYVGTRYEHEDGWRAATPSRTATLFGKLGVTSGTWDATLSYAAADNRIFQAGSLPESAYAA